MAVDVGDAVEYTFLANTGATVIVSWLAPDGSTFTDRVTVAESPAGSGRYPYTIVPNAPGLWEASYDIHGTQTGAEKLYLRVVPLTGPPPLATVGEVSAQFGALTPDQETLTGTLLRAASKMLRAKYPLVDSQIAGGVLDAEVVAQAAVAMVLRVLRNPQGLRSETVGPFTRTYDTTLAAGLLVIGAGEDTLLRPRTPTRAKAGTIMARPGLAPYPHGTRRWMR